MSPYPIAYAVDDKVLPSPSTVLLAVQQRKLALRLGCAFLDRLSMEGGAEQSLKWLNTHPKLLSGDNVHLTRAGAEKVGNDIANLLLKQLTGEGRGGS